MLEEGTEAILTSEGFSAYLRMMARFHAYSFNNVILIHTQKPDATAVSSYDRWQEFGRQVKKGEKGIKIFFPMFAIVERENPDTGEMERVRKVRSFGIGNVFDVSQTEVDPLPKTPSIVEDVGVTDASQAVNLRLSRFLIDEGVRMESLPIAGEARGFWDPVHNRIVIRSDDTSPFSITRTGTLVHEAAHREAGHRGHVDRRDAEAVAEGSAYVVLQHFGIDTGQKSFPYIAGWARDKDVLRRNLNEIQTIATQIISVIAGALPRNRC